MAQLVVPPSLPGHQEELRFFVAAKTIGMHFPCSRALQKIPALPQLPLDELKTRFERRVHRHFFDESIRPARMGSQQGGNGSSGHLENGLWLGMSCSGHESSCAGSSASYSILSSKLGTSQRLLPQVMEIVPHQPTHPRPWPTHGCRADEIRS